MEFNINAKNQTQYNWKFYVKLTLGLLPLISIIIFFAAQLADLLNDPVEFWKFIFKIGNADGDRLKEFNMVPMPIKEVDGVFVNNWSKGRMVEFIIFRNAGMLTTLGNIFASAFFLDSAVHNSHEGMKHSQNGGVLDNYRCGLAVVNILTFIVLAYNLSLVQSKAVSIMKWYNYVTWMCEHLLVPILMIVYFFMFYPKDTNGTKTYSNRTKNWFSFMWTSCVFLWFYQIVFTILGFILKAAHAFPIFGDMSSNGYFPYNYMDFSSSNVTPKLMGMSHATEFVIAMFLLVIEQVATFAIYYAAVEHQIKIKQK